MIIPLVIQTNYPPYTRIALTLISTVNVYSEQAQSNERDAVPTQDTGHVR
jgi:hypothetical protein